MTVHRVMWKPASAVLTPACGVQGTQYLFDDASQEVIAQEVVYYHENLRQVVRQVTLAPADVPSEVRQCICSLGFGRLTQRALDALARLV